MIYFLIDVIDPRNLFKKISKNKKILKKLLFTKKIISKSKVKIGEKTDDKILLGYVLNYDENDKKQNKFILDINKNINDNRRKIGRNFVNGLANFNGIMVILIEVLVHKSDLFPQFLGSQIGKYKTQEI